LNGSVVHFTSLLAYPSFCAIAYATALSKPRPFVGSLSSKYGGKAGLSVATVSVPGLRVCSWSFVHLSAAFAPVAVLLEALDDDEEPLSLDRRGRGARRRGRRRGGRSACGQP
jgi:hypothetical protein